MFSNDYKSYTQNLYIFSIKKKFLIQNNLGNSSKLSKKDALL